jgi:tRNA threonylcarbamoyl adenosine modification protein YeaZ
MTEPIFLAVDTSTAQISVAISQGEKVLATETRIDALRHAELASVLIQAALKQASLSVKDIDIYLCGIGPGPFTGLRVGIISAKVLAMVNQKPLYGICSHDAIAFTQSASGPFTIITDARRKEVYATEYQENKRLNTPLVKKREEIKSHRVITGVFPLAENLIRQAQFALANGEKLQVKNFVLDEAENDGSKVKLPSDILLPAIPLYLRIPDAKPKA